MFRRNQTSIAVFVALVMLTVALVGAGRQAHADATQGGISGAASSAHAGLPPANPTTIPSPIPTAQGTQLPTPMPTDCDDPFVDIQSDIFHNAIHSLYCAGKVNGTDATHFGPSASATRAQFSKLVVLAFAVPAFTPVLPSFTDVPPTYFAYSYIEAGRAAGILGGYSASQCLAAHAIYPCYLPNRNITRAELASLVVRAAHYPLTTPARPTFVDVPANNFAYAAIETAYARAIIHGIDATHYAPTRPIRRDEMCQFIYAAITHPLARAQAAAALPTGFAAQQSWRGGHWPAPRCLPEVVLSSRATNALSTLRPVRLIQHQRQCNSSTTRSQYPA